MLGDHGVVLRLPVRRDHGGGRQRGGRRRHGIPRLHARPARAGAIAGLSIFLLFWVCASAGMYISFCSAFFPCSRFAGCVASICHALSPCLRAVGWLLCLPRRCARAVRARLRRPGRGGGGAAAAAAALPRSITQSQTLVIDVLPREPPARGG